MIADAIRPSTEADIPWALAQTDREGWDASREAFLVHLRHDPDGCFLAEANGRRIGMVIRVQ